MTVNPKIPAARTAAELPAAFSLRAGRGAALALALAALAGCSGGREMIGDSLGLNYESPNPFNVSPHAPLRLPSSFETLPPPQPGIRSPLEAEPRQSAAAALASAGAGSTRDAAGASPSPAELSLLAASGADSADPGIRQTLAQERPETGDSRYGLNSLFGYPINDPDIESTLNARDAAEDVRGRGGLTPTPSPRAPEPQGNNLLQLQLGD